MPYYENLPGFAHDSDVMSDVIEVFGIECVTGSGTFSAVLFHGDSPYQNGDLLVAENDAFLLTFQGNSVSDSLRQGDSLDVGGKSYKVREKTRADSTGLLRIYISLENIAAPPTPPVPSVIGAGGYFELNFTAADISLGNPMLIGILPNDSLVRNVVVRFSVFFDTEVSLMVGQDGKKKIVYDGINKDTDGCLKFFYEKLSGAVYLYHEVSTAPTVGAGVIYLTY